MHGAAAECITGAGADHGRVRGSGERHWAVRERSIGSGERCGIWLSLHRP